MAFFRVLASKFIQRWEAAVINEDICRSILKNLIFASRFAHHYHHTPIGITQHERDSITIGRTSHLGNSRSIVINQRRSLPFSHYAFRSLSAFPLFSLALLGTAMLSIRTMCLPPEAPNQARRLTLKTALTSRTVCLPGPATQGNGWTIPCHLHTVEETVGKYVFLVGEEGLESHEHKVSAVRRRAVRSPGTQAGGTDMKLFPDPGAPHHRHRRGLRQNSGQVHRLPAHTKRRRASGPSIRLKVR